MVASSKTIWFLRRVVAPLALLAVPFGLAAGCSSDPPAPKNNYHSCKLNSDCKGSLVCSFGLCHAQCADTGDCPAPQRCVRVNSSEASGEGSGKLGEAGATRGICQLRKVSPLHFMCASSRCRLSACASPVLESECLPGRQCLYGLRQPSE
jgi:hypothetical protein